LKILIDMNLLPEWVQELRIHEIEAVHWSEVGTFDAPDVELMNWARKNNRAIFTHDLDFGTLLALTKAESPSVIQIRTQDVTVKHLTGILMPALLANTAIIDDGALLTLDEDKMRLRILPLK
jgi:predicted nuclease of predicted toxin-antitoxin system